MSRERLAPAVLRARERTLGLILGAHRVQIIYSVQRALHDDQR